MSRKKFSPKSRFVLACCVVVATMAMAMTMSDAMAQERVLYSFNTSGNGGYDALGGLVVDTKGNFYGTTFKGGTYGGGTAFELNRNAQGIWTETVLYEFGNGADGGGPNQTLVFDASGNLYGTTEYGGSGLGGTAFELMPAANGSWTEAVIFNFQYGGRTGANPHGNLIFDHSGNLYGTTLSGGDLSGCEGFGCGAVYELSPGDNGTWSESVLYAPPDTYSHPYPIGGLVFDSAGNLYGANSDEVFQLAPVAGGPWEKKTLHTFVEYTSDGYNPNGNLIFDAAGNLYGTTFVGGTGLGAKCGNENCGTVFELSPITGGGVRETILHNFSQAENDGILPQSGVILGTNGVLYGTTPWGGKEANCGVSGACGIAFALSPGSGGEWTEQILFHFDGLNDGAYNPQGVLLLGPGGYLYGTTTSGGPDDGGTVFAIKP